MLNQSQFVITSAILKYKRSEWFLCDLINYGCVLFYKIMLHRSPKVLTMSVGDANLLDKLKQFIYKSTNLPLVTRLV